MPNVPERKLSYGELLEQFRTIHKTRTRQKEQAKALKPRTSRPRNEYSYEEIIEKLKQL